MSWLDSPYNGKFLDEPASPPPSVPEQAKPKTSWLDLPSGQNEQSLETPRLPAPPRPQPKAAQASEIGFQNPFRAPLPQSPEDKPQPPESRAPISEASQRLPSEIANIPFVGGLASAGLALGQEIGNAIDQFDAPTQGTENTAAPVENLLKGIPGINMATLAAESVSPEFQKAAQTPLRDVPVLGGLTRGVETITNALGASGRTVAEPLAGPLLYANEAIKFSPSSGLSVNWDTENVKKAGTTPDELARLAGGFFTGTNTPEANQRFEQLSRQLYQTESATQPVEATVLTAALDPLTYVDVAAVVPKIGGMMQLRRAWEAAGDVTRAGETVGKASPLEQILFRVLSPKSIGKGELLAEDAIKGFPKPEASKAVNRILRPFEKTPTAMVTDTVTRADGALRPYLSSDGVPFADKLKFVDAMKEAIKRSDLRGAIEPFFGKGVANSPDVHRAIRSMGDYDATPLLKRYESSMSLLKSIEDAQHSGRPVYNELEATAIRASAKELGRGTETLFDTVINGWKEGKLDLNEAKRGIENLAGIQLANDLMEHMAGNLAAKAKIPLPNAVTRLMNTFRAYEGLVYVGGSPATIATNIVNNIGQMVKYGVTPQDLSTFWKRIGYQPPSNIGELVSKATKGAYQSNSLPFGGAIPERARNIPVIKQLGDVWQRSEQWSRNQAWATGFERFMSANFTPPPLGDVLTRHILDTQGQEGVARTMRALKNARNYGEAEAVLVKNVPTWTDYIDKVATEQTRILSELAGRPITITPEILMDALPVQTREQWRNMFALAYERSKKSGDFLGEWRRARSDMTAAEAGRDWFGKDWQGKRTGEAQEIAPFDAAKPKPVQPPELPRTEPIGKVTLSPRKPITNIDDLTSQLEETSALQARIKEQAMRGNRVPEPLTPEMRAAFQRGEYNQLTENQFVELVREEAGLQGFKDAAEERGVRESYRAQVKNLPPDTPAAVPEPKPEPPTQPSAAESADSLLANAQLRTPEQEAARVDAIIQRKARFSKERLQQLMLQPLEVRKAFTESAYWDGKHFDEMLDMAQTSAKKHAPKVETPVGSTVPPAAEAIDPDLARRIEDFKRQENAWIAPPKAYDPNVVADFAKQLVNEEQIPNQLKARFSQDEWAAMSAQQREFALKDSLARRADVEAGQPFPPGADVYQSGKQAGVEEIPAPKVATTPENIVARAKQSVANLPPDRAEVVNNIFGDEWTSTKLGFERIQREMDALDARAPQMTLQEWKDNVTFESPNTLFRWGFPEERPLTRQEARILNNVIDNASVGSAVSKWAKVRAGELADQTAIEWLNKNWRQLRTNEYKQLHAQAGVAEIPTASVRDIPTPPIGISRDIPQPPDLSDVFRAALDKGIGTASKGAVPDNAHLINALNDTIAKHNLPIKPFTKPELKVLAKGERPRTMNFKELTDELRARADEAIKVLDSYTPEPLANEFPTNAPLERPARPLPDLTTLTDDELRRIADDPYRFNPERDAAQKELERRGTKPTQPTNAVRVRYADKMIETTIPPKEITIGAIVESKSGSGLYKRIEQIKGDKLYGVDVYFSPDQQAYITTGQQTMDGWYPIENFKPVDVEQTINSGARYPINDTLKSWKYQLESRTKAQQQAKDALSKIASKELMQRADEAGFLKAPDKWGHQEPKKTKAAQAGFEKLREELTAKYKPQADKIVKEYAADIEEAQNKIAEWQAKLDNFQSPIEYGNVPPASTGATLGAGEAAKAIGQRHNPLDPIEKQIADFITETHKEHPEWDHRRLFAESVKEWSGTVPADMKDFVKVYKKVVPVPSGATPPRVGMARAVPTNLSPQEAEAVKVDYENYLKTVFNKAKEQGAQSVLDPQINGAWNDALTQTMLDSMEKAIAEGQNPVRVIPPDVAAAMQGYLKGQYLPALNEAKAGANATGRFFVDSTVLNYDGRWNIDDGLALAAPFTFWWLHTLANYTRDFIDHPALLAFYVRLRQNLDKQSEGMPDRFKHRVQMPMPLADRMGVGDTIWADPLRALMPVSEVYKLTDLEKASYNTVKEDGTTDYNSVFQDLFGIHTPYKLGMALLTGHPDELQNIFASIPAARLLRGVTSLATPGGIGLQSEYDKFYYERALKELVAEGKLTPDEMKIALLQQSGKAWDMARQRAGLENYGVRELSALTGMRGYAFTPGEQKFLDAQKQRDTLTADAVRRLGGNPNLTPEQQYEFLNKKGFYQSPEYQQFREQHPELDAISFVNKAYGEGGARLPEPAAQEARYRAYLVDSIWNAYFNAPELKQKLIVADLGEPFKSTFLAKPTEGARNYDKIPTPALLGWANAVGAQLVNVAQMEPQTPDPYKVTFTSDAQNQAYQKFYDEVAQSIGWDKVREWGAYQASLDKATKRVWFESPDGKTYKTYLNYRDAFYAKHPDIAKILEQHDLKQPGTGSSTARTPSKPFYLRESYNPRVPFPRQPFQRSPNDNAQKYASTRSLYQLFAGLRQRQPQEPPRPRTEYRNPGGYQ